MMSCVFWRGSLTVWHVKSTQAAACSRPLQSLAGRSALGTAHTTPCAGMHESCAATCCRGPAGRWNYLTMQLARTSEDPAGDPDLYGMFYGGAAAQVSSRLPMGTAQYTLHSLGPAT